MPISCLAAEEVYLDLTQRERHLYDTGRYEYGNNSLKSDEEEESYLKPSFGMFMNMLKEDFAEDESSDKPSHKKKQKRISKD